MSCNLKEAFSDNMIKSFITPSLFCVLFLLQIVGVDETFFKNSKNNDDGNISDNCDCIILKNIDLVNYTTYLADCVLKVAASRIFKKNFSKTKQYFDCCEKINLMEKCTKELIQRVNCDGNKDIQNDLIIRGFDDFSGGMCAEAVFMLHSDFLGTENLKSVLESIFEDHKLLFSQYDILNVWLPQVFTVESGFDLVKNYDDNDDDGNDNNSVHELSLLKCHLQKHVVKEDSLLRNIYTNWLDKIFKMKKLSTYEIDLSCCSLKDIQLSANIAELLSIIVQNYSADITEHSGWDFTMIATASWISSLKKTTSTSYKNYFSLPILHLLNSVCHLFKSLSNHIASEDDNAQLKTEWNDVFVSDLHKTIVDTWVNIADDCKKGLVHPIFLIPLNELGTIIGDIINVSAFIDEANISSWLEICCQHLHSSVTDVQISAFNLLIKLTPHLVASDSQCSEEKTASVGVSFKHIEESLKQMQTIVATMLSDFKLGDTCIVKPFTDGYMYTRSYLLLWLFILEICDKSDSQLRFMYTAWIKENHFLEYLMKSLFCLMPEEAVHGHEGSIKHIQDFFSYPPDFSIGYWESKTLAHLSCWTYYKLLSRLPAEVRQWWSEIDHKLATIVERLTTTFVSPIICSNEMKAIRHEGKKFQNMTVRIHPAAREVVAVYIVEESSTELVIQLPANHPLGPTKVESGRCMVSSSQTRNWIMQLSLSLTHQNGSIWDALSLWKTLIDKKFEGVEECYICFAILHNVTQQLPRLTCPTCKKKFHNTCLYQWFTTSNKSTCPICRNLF